MYQSNSDLNLVWKRTELCSSASFEISGVSWSLYQQWSMGWFESIPAISSLVSALEQWFISSAAAASSIDWSIPLKFHYMRESTLPYVDRACYKKYTLQHFRKMDSDHSVIEQYVDCWNRQSKSKMTYICALWWYMSQYLNYGISVLHCVFHQVSVKRNEW